MDRDAILVTLVVEQRFVIYKLLLEGNLPQPNVLLFLVVCYVGADCGYVDSALCRTVLVQMTGFLVASTACVGRWWC